jgi:predicted ribosome quality control (RQC) complex YloA/Tae2 family protein
MVKVLTSLELSVVIRELQQLMSVKVNKIHQPSSRVLIINLFQTGGTKFLLKIDSGVGMYLTSYSLENPLTPTSFCMFLRKSLNNAKMIAIKQKSLERIVEIHFDTREGLRILVCELFSKGNFILCDGAYKILNCAAIQQWKGRIIKRGEIYKYPPEGFNLFALTQSVFQEYLSQYPQHQTVKLIATLGFGGTYAEEICIIAKVKKDTIVQMLKPEEIASLYSAVSQILKNFKTSNSATIYYEDSLAKNATPFEIQFYSDFESKLISSFNSALDILYTSAISSKVKQDSDAKYQQEKQRLQAIESTQEETYNEYERNYNQSRKIAELIYSQYQTISTIFSKIKQAVDSGYDWYEVYQVLQKEKDAGIYEANLVKEIKPETRQIIINVGDELKLDLTKSLEENASDYYDKAKKIRAKLEGVQNTLNDVQQKLVRLDKNRESMQQKYTKREPKLIEKKKQEWYEKFHWFFTSSGLLAIGGRDATSNEIIVKKYVEINDVVFHTDIAGSPFFILKEGRNKATEQDLKEVAQATASYSSAWKLGVGATDVYQVSPQQVSKQAQSGEYLGKGAFVISGKRNYYRGTSLEVAIGVLKDGRIMAGASSAIRKHCTNIFVIRQGDLKKSDIAKQLAHKFGTDVDSTIKLIPTGESNIINN